jgi:hypothetical protein
MPDRIEADASPEKRLFISLITRDISLIDAFLDIIDNSINAALEPMADRLKTADDYERLLSNARVKPKVKIDITVGTARIVVQDNASGISAKMAAEHVFKFGRSEEGKDGSDRLSVYGIGLKRAMFKCGNRIDISSDHSQGGFDLKLNVRNWSRLHQDHWHFEITRRAPSKTETGTRIAITDMNDDVLRRLDDGLFTGQLRNKIARTYAFFLGRVIDINLNGTPVAKEALDIGENHSSYKFAYNGVSCNITAGIVKTKSESFKERNAGWFVFCNGRAIIAADTSPLTGWTGGGTGLPLFQPKHRAFIGTVFFVSADPEALPWTTTKSSVNEESAVWQQAKRHMLSVGRVVTGFLDRRYTEEGTVVLPSELQGASGKTVSVLAAAVSEPREFKAPKKTGPKEMTIQYKAKIEDVTKIASYLRRPSMTGSEIGRYTFTHFLENEVQ